MRNARHGLPSGLARLIVTAGLALPAASVPRQVAADTGVIVGQVAAPDTSSDDTVFLAVLLPPRWAVIWNTEVQQRIDTSFANNIAAVDQNRELFNVLALRARREATEVVIARMQAELGQEFSERSVREVSENGAFEFADVGFGDYRIVVIGQSATSTAIWAQSVAVRSAVPEFVEMGEPIQ